MSFGCTYTVDQILIRTLEGLTFPCKVLAVQPGKKYRVKYFDDGNVEDLVEEDDLVLPDRDTLDGLKGEDVMPERRIMPVAPAGEIPPGLAVEFMGAVEDGGVKVIVHGEDDVLMSPIPVSRATKGEEKGCDMEDEEERKEGDGHGGYGGDVGDNAVRGGGLRALRALRK
jgi:hypothetical protein